jgi:hypothetical protein
MDNIEKNSENKKKEDQTPMMAYFELQGWLQDKKNENKPIEVKSAMVWGALWVLHHSGEITWDQMRNMYGEFMSFVTGMR